MILPALLFLSLGPGPLPNIACQNNQTLHTAPLRSAAGFTTVLTMHSEDDSGKNTHWCQVDYTLEITNPDGSVRQPAAISTTDDAWGRSLIFRIDGFSQDGSHAFLFISEADQKSSLASAVNYDMRSGTNVSVFFHPPRRLSPACAATLHIVGTSPPGLIVLATSLSAGCTREEKWQLNRQNNDGAISPEFPAALPPKTAVSILDPGSSRTNH